jgi:phosphate transport system substrate-binding protein
VRQSLKFALFVCGVTGLLACQGCGKRGSDATQINAGGATFVQPMIEKWSEVYLEQKGVRINYLGQGSGAGIKGLIDKTFDFSCSDAPLNKDQTEQALKAGGEVVHIPLVMGAVVPIYNLPEITKPLKFTGPVLADIFMGKITNWNDKALQDLQDEDVKLPDRSIAPQYRADGSGTTFIFTSYLSAVSPTWKEKIGAGTTVKWPVGSGNPQNNGVANAVKQGAGAIGYVELIYALGNKISYGMVQNRDGVYLKADLDNVTAAAAGAEVPEDLKISLINLPGKNSYPISGTNWAISYVNPPSGKGKQIADFLRWATHEGQEYAKTLHYARLPQPVVDKLDKKLAMIKTE